MWGTSHTPNARHPTLHAQRTCQRDRPRLDKTMKLAAIDIGTNSIHMIVVNATGGRSFEIMEREKEMVKLGAGVFATKRLSDRAFESGLETIRRYVQLADQLGVDEIITAATSAIREAHNGDDFLEAVVSQTGISPRIISGKEEARLIFLAVRNAIALPDDNTLVFDIGGGSTEAVVGNREQVLFGNSIQLGVQRLLDMFEDPSSIGTEARGVLEAHIQFLAQKSVAKARHLGFTQVIGTSGTIRTLGEAALAADGKSLQSVNAEVVALSEIEKLTQHLLELDQEERAEVDGISQKRADAIHLGGVLLIELLRMAEVEEITLCDASLREGLILDYLERHAQALNLPAQNLRHRKMAQLAYKYEADWQQNSHVACLAVQLFDQLKELHNFGTYEREMLEYAALVHDIGQYIRFKRQHKHSRYIVKHTDPRGFTDEEVLLIGHLTRYHRKAEPKKKHKKFKQLSKSDRYLVQVLSGILRIAVGLNKTKNQLVEQISCQVSDEEVVITISGADHLELELWAARRDRKVLAKALKRELKIQGATE